MFERNRIKKKLLLISFFASTLIVISNLNVFGQKTSVSQVIITIERTDCFGSCPVYSAQIYADGTVVYEGKDFVKVVGRKEHKISADRIKKLINEFDTVKFFSLKDKYETDENGKSYTDQPTTTTSISIDGKQKKVINYLGAPKKLVELEDKIDEIAGLYEYIGPV